MSKLLFGKQLSAYDDTDIDDLLSKLTPEEIEELNNEVDPDNSLLPPSQRCRDQTSKTATGKFDRESLIKFLEEEAMKLKDRDYVPFEKKIRGTVFQRKMEETRLSNKELTDMGFDTEIDSEFDEVLRDATEEELVDLAAVLGFTGMLNQVQFHASLENKAQECGGFQGVARAEKLKLVPDEPPNTTDIEESISKVEKDDPKLEDLNLNNIKNISAEQIARLCKAVKGNSKLKALHCANTNLTNKMGECFVEMLEDNKALTSLNLESNFLTGETLVRLLGAINGEHSKMKEFYLSNQRQRVLGVKNEMEIAKLVLDNPRLIKLGMDFETADARNRVRDHLQNTYDQVTRQRRRSMSKD